MLEFWKFKRSVQDRTYHQRVLDLEEEEKRERREKEAEQTSGKGGGGGGGGGREDRGLVEEGEVNVRSSP